MQTKLPRSCRRGPISVPDSDDDSLSSVYEPDTDESSDDDEVLSTESVSLSIFFSIFFLIIFSLPPFPLLLLLRLLLTILVQIVSGGWG